MVLLVRLCLILRFGGVLSSFFKKFVGLRFVAVGVVRVAVKICIFCTHIVEILLLVAASLLVVKWRLIFGRVLLLVLFVWS